jgi:FMN reductase
MIMKIVGISDSIVGFKTRTSMNYLSKEVSEKYPEAEYTSFDLAEYNLSLATGGITWNMKAIQVM